MVHTLNSRLHDVATFFISIPKEEEVENDDRER